MTMDPRHRAVSPSPAAGRLRRATPRHHGDPSGPRIALAILSHELPMPTRFDLNALTARVIAARGVAHARAPEPLSRTRETLRFGAPALTAFVLCLDALAARLAAACMRAGRCIADPRSVLPAALHDILRPGALGGVSIANQTMRELLP